MAKSVSMTRLGPVALAAGALLASACSGHQVGVYDDTMSAEGIDGLLVDVGEGELKITGDSELDEIQVEVTLFNASCHDDEEVVRSLYIELRELEEGTARLAVFLDENNAYADVVVRMPDTMQLDVTDEDGDIVIENSADVWLEDGDGDVKIKTVRGDVQVDDGDGDLVIKDVDGDVDVTDGSGDIVIDGVTGSVSIDDGSGDVQVSDVGNLYMD